MAELDASNDNTGEASVSQGAESQSTNETVEQQPLNDSLKEKIEQVISKEEPKKEDVPKGHNQDKSVVPEKYEVKVPEGFEKLDEELLKEFEPIAKAKGFSQEEYQAAIDMHAKAIKKQQEAYKTQTEQIHKKWDEELKSDKEFGGSDSTLAKTQEEANRALSKYWSPDFVKTLTESGWLKHPEFVKGLARKGRELSEGAIIKGEPAGAAVNKVVPSADNLFPTGVPKLKQ